MKANLASSPSNAVLTVVFGAVLAWATYRLVRFVFVTADWEIVRRNLRLFMVGRFPADQLWRPWAAAYVLAAVLGLTPGRAAARAARVAPIRRDRLRRALGGVRGGAPAVLAPAAVRRGHPVADPDVLPGVLAARPRGRDRRGPPGSGAGCPAWPAGCWVIVPSACSWRCRSSSRAAGSAWDGWGGLQLALFVTVVGIVVAFPLGVLAALGRRSRLPVAAHGCAVGYIELFRGVPLVAFLLHRPVRWCFYAFPTSVDPPSFLVRALIVIVLFESAYIAEIVRGGLQSVPEGQIEAAQALGLRPVRRRCARSCCRRPCAT